MPKSFSELGENKGGDPNIMKLEGTNKVRPLDNMVAEWRQHVIEDPNDPEKMTMVVCPGPRSCPLCRKPADPQGQPYFPVSKRFAVCVWDYASNGPKVLIAGPQVFEPFKESAKFGIDPTTCDWDIVKEGVRRNTKYHVVRHNAEEGPHATPEMILDVAKYEAPESPERIFDILEKYGIDYDALPIPHYTLDEALAFEMPYTTHKGLTIEQLLAADSDFAEWLHGTKLEQGALGDPVFIALQTALESRGMVKPLDDALASMPEQPQPQAATTTQSPAPAAAAPAATEQPELADPGPDEVRLIAVNGIPANVPKNLEESLLAAGFTKPEPPAPAEEPQAATDSMDANTPTEVVIAGQTVTLPRSEALGLIASETATWPPSAEEDAPVEEEPPKLPLPDQEVQVNIGGNVVPMMFVTAEKLVESGSAGFAEEEVALAYMAWKDKADQESVREQAATEQANPGSVPAGEAAGDEDKPHTCPHCGAKYKSKGGLTQHVNKNHAGAPAPAQSAAAPPAAATPAEPAAAASAPATTPAPSGGGDLLERVKDKIAQSPFARDYTKIIDIFREETGKSNVTEMNEAELTKLEARIDKEIAGG